MGALKRPLTKESPTVSDSSVEPLATDPASAGSRVARAPGVVTSLLEQLYRQEIAYCRWQGNEPWQAEKAVPQGLDILPDRKDALRMAAILAQAGFKRVVAAALPPDPGAEHHYLALEQDSCRIVHLHLRYHLAIGDERLNEYRLPWEPLVLSTRRLDRQAGMYVADPSVEFLFLLVQVALDLRLGSRVRHRLGTPWCCPRRLREVHRRLRGDAGPVADLSRRLLGAAAADLVSDIVAAEPSFTKVGAFRRCAAPVLNGYRLYRRGGARWRRWWRELSVAARADRIAARPSAARAMGGGPGHLGGGSGVRTARQAAHPDARSQPWSRGGLRPLPTEPVPGLQRRADAEELAGPSVAAAPRPGGVGGRAVSLGRARRAGSGPEAPRPAGRGAAAEAGHGAAGSRETGGSRPQPPVPRGDRNGRHRRG